MIVVSIPVLWHKDHELRDSAALRVRSRCALRKHKKAASAQAASEREHVRLSDSRVDASASTSVRLALHDNIPRTTGFLLSPICLYFEAAEEIFASPTSAVNATSLTRNTPLRIL